MVSCAVYWASRHTFACYVSKTLLADVAAGEHHPADDCVVTSPLQPSRGVLDATMLQKALSPLHQQQQEITDQLTALNDRLSTLQSELSRYSFGGGLHGTGLLHGNDILVVAGVLLLQLLLLWWLVRPSVVAAEHPSHTQ